MECTHLFYRLYSGLDVGQTRDNVNHAKTYIGPWEAQPHATAGRAEGFDERARGRSGLSKPKKHDTNPFGDALRETSERKGGIIDELTRHAVALSPVIKRPHLPRIGERAGRLVLGWAQLPSTRAVAFRFGIFPDPRSFCAGGVPPIRMAAYSWAPTPTWTVQDMQARFMFGKEKEVTLPDGEAAGRKRRAAFTFRFLPCRPWPGKCAASWAWFGAWPWSWC